jgi:hypothetical protein
VSVCLPPPSIALYSKTQVEKDNGGAGPDANARRKTEKEEEPVKRNGIIVIIIITIITVNKKKGKKERNITTRKKRGYEIRRRKKKFRQANVGTLTATRSRRSATRFHCLSLSLSLSEERPPQLQRRLVKVGRGHGKRWCLVGFSGGGLAFELRREKGTCRP